MTPEEKAKMQTNALRRTGDGVSARSHMQMKEAGVGPYEGAPAPTAPAAGYSQGQDTAVITDFKQRQHADRAKVAGVPATISPEELDRITLQRKLRKQ
jgi:hypothetical protein